MLCFSYFVNSFLREIKDYFVLGKYNGKIKVSPVSLQLNSLQNLRLRGVYLELRV